jgi:hypothetical protein
MPGPATRSTHSAPRPVDGALGDNAKNLIRDLVKKASANSCPTTNLRIIGAPPNLLDPSNSSLALPCAATLLSNCERLPLHDAT